jgi:succinate-acetate transporter protein
VTHPDVHQPGPQIENITRVVLRPVATPVPLGLLALALGSVLLAAVQLQWVSLQSTPQVALVILVFVVPLQALATILCFPIRDVVMSTGFGLLTASWAATASLLTSGQPGTRNQVLGVLAVAVAVALLVPALGATWSKPAGATVMFVAALRFALTGAYQLGASNTWQTVSAIIGLVLVGTALYAAAAFLLEDARHHRVLPVSRRSTSHYAMSGELGHQLDSLPAEAGVRQES